MNTNELCNYDERCAGFSAHLSDNGVIVMKKDIKGNYKIFEDLKEVALEDLHDMLKEYI